MRTFSNAFECCFFMMGIYYWHRSGVEKPALLSKSFALLTFIVTLSFIFRNSSLVPWIPLVAYWVLAEKWILQAVSHGILIAIPLILLATFCDYLYYGQLTVVSWNFLKFNVLSGGSDYFGIEHIFSYITFYLPTQLLVFFPFLVYGAWILIWD